MGNMKIKMMEAQEKDIDDGFDPNSAFIESIPQDKRELENSINIQVGFMQSDLSNILKYFSEQIYEHDCHLGQDSGCQTCENLFTIVKYIKIVKDLIKKL